MYDVLGLDCKKFRGERRVVASKEISTIGRSVFGLDFL